MRISPGTPASLYREQTTSLRPAGQGFLQLLKEALDDVNRLQVASDKAVEQVAAGDAANLHQVLITAEKARLSLQLTVRVTSKMIEAYQELSRMQI